MIECLLAQAVLREIEVTKQELCMKAAIAGSSGPLQLVASTEVYIRASAQRCCQASMPLKAAKC